MKSVEEKVAEQFSLTKKLAGEVVKFVVDSMKDELTETGEVKISGIGKVFVKEQDAREARNPKTGEKIQVAAKKGVGFKATKALKDLLNQGSK